MVFREVIRAPGAVLWQPPQKHDGGPQFPEFLPAVVAISEVPSGQRPILDREHVVQIAVKRVGIEVAGHGVPTAARGGRNCIG